MSRSNTILSWLSAGTVALALCLSSPIHASGAETDDSDNTPAYSPVVNGAALRGLSAVVSAEPIGAGRITFNVMPTWYMQQTGYLNTPTAGASIFTGTMAFSCGVNSNIDLFGSLAGFASSNYPSTEGNSGTGSISAGAMGSLPFPENAYVRMGGVLEIIGGASQNQIDPYGMDGYDYFDTHSGYDVIGQLLQTIRFGGGDNVVKLHLNEGGVVGEDNEEPTLLLLGAGLEAPLGIAVLGMEINSRTNFNDLSFATDPLWVTPSITVRTPYNMNVMAGVDVSLSANRSNNDPQALEPYRIFGALAFSYDLLANRRRAEFAEKQRAAREQEALENSAARSAEQLLSLTKKTVDDSIALAGERKKAFMQMDSLQHKAYNDERACKAAVDALAKKATADSLALIQAQNTLAYERAGRSDEETKLLSTGELPLDAVYFKPGETVVSINSKRYLTIIGKMLLKYPKLQIEVAGHTDNIGSENYNASLSRARADAVRNYLTEVAPSLNQTLRSRGYGADYPKADNNTEEGRLQNRRVELRVMNKDVLQEYSQR